MANGDFSRGDFSAKSGLSFSHTLSYRPTLLKAIEEKPTAVLPATEWGKGPLLQREGMWYNSRKAAVIPRTAGQMRNLCLLPASWPHTTARSAVSQKGTPCARGEILTRRKEGARWSGQTPICLSTSTAGSAPGAGRPQDRPGRPPLLGGALSLGPGGERGGLFLPLYPAVRLLPKRRHQRPPAGAGGQ